MPPASVVEPRRRGHIVEIAADWSEGRLATARDGCLRAAANPRGMQGYAPAGELALASRGIVRDVRRVWPYPRADPRPGRS